MRKLPDNSIDSCVTDSPYLLEFMSKAWDKANEIDQHDDIHAPNNKYAFFHYQWAKEVLRILKPGGHLLSFGGTRTYHRMVQGIEDAGFEIRDTIMWVYASGFPKSLNISKQLDKDAGAEREVIGERIERGGKRNRNPIDDERFGYAYRKTGDNTILETAPSTAAAKQWEGWGTALKPANEPIVLARKPLIGTVAENVLKYGTGGINIDESRIESKDKLDRLNITSPFGNSLTFSGGAAKARHENNSVQGRFPSNLIMDEFMSAELDKMSGVSKSSQSYRGLQHSGRHGGLADIGRNLKEGTDTIRGHSDSGGASRFFYCAKSSKRERSRTNDHCTVKPIKLCEYLVKLITPKGAVCLDPFAGSGTTLLAAKNVGCNYIGFEKEEHHFRIIERRFKIFCKQQSLF